MVVPVFLSLCFHPGYCVLSIWLGTLCMAVWSRCGCLVNSRTIPCCYCAAIAWVYVLSYFYFYFFHSMSLHLFLSPPVSPLLASYSRYPLSYLLIPSSLYVDSTIVQHISLEARTSFPGKFIHPNFTAYDT